MTRSHLLVILLAIASVAVSIAGAAWLMTSPVVRSERPLPAIPEGLEAEATALSAHLQRYPDDGASWKRLGRVLLALERHEEATRAYVEAADRLPTDPDVNRALRRLAEIAAQGRDEPRSDEAGGKD